MAVTGLGDPDRLLRKDAAVAGMPLSLTKPLGLGVLASRHKATGEVFPQAVATMTALNREASRAAVAAGVAGGDRRHRVRAARAPVHDAAVLGRRRPGACRGRADARRRPPGRARRLRQRRHAADAGVGASPPRGRAGGSEEDLVLLADAQTSGGLLVVGEVPGGVVVGETVAGAPRVEVRG